MLKEVSPRYLASVITLYRFTYRAITDASFLKGTALRIQLLQLRDIFSQTKSLKKNAVIVTRMILPIDLLCIK